ncbi:MAG: hypothetical protein RLW87_20315 [Alphaproteobacteria bacterium]
MNIRTILTLLAIAGLAACSPLGSTEEDQPEIGSSIDDYKRSPCACLEIEQEGRAGWERLLPGLAG